MMHHDHLLLGDDSLYVGLPPFLLLLRFLLVYRQTCHIHCNQVGKYKVLRIDLQKIPVLLLPFTEIVHHRG